MTRLTLLALTLTACAPLPEPEEAPTQDTEPPPVAAATAPEATTITIPEYDRDEWHKRWFDADKDCQDTRQEVLIAESTTPPVMDERGCRVQSGTWPDPYTGTTFTEPGLLDIDHFIALSNAHHSGGWMWDAEKRSAFANDLDNPAALIAVDRSANRSKGDRGPDEWLPPNEAYHCEYVKLWVEVKAKWELSLTAKEVQAILALKCD